MLPIMECQNRSLKLFKAVCAVSVISFVLLFTNTTRAEQSLSILHGYTPFNSQNVPLNALKYQVAIPSLPWKGGISFTMGQFSGP